MFVIVNGVVIAVDFMLVILFIFIVGVVLILGFDGFYYVVVGSGGYVFLGLLLVLYLWKFGKYILLDFIGDCYYFNVVCIIVVIVVFIIFIIFIVG